MHIFKAFPLDNSPGYLINRLAAKMNAALHWAFKSARCNITAQQWAALNRLWEENGLHQSLLERTTKNQHNVSRTLTLQEKQRLLERRPDPEDVTLQRIYLTEKGAKLQDVLVPIAHSLIDTSLDLDVYVANLAYNFIHSERARFGVGIGVHAADIDLDISAKATIAGEEIPLGEEAADLIAPVPNLYAYGAYAFTERFLFRYGGGWLSLNYYDYEGSLIFANAFLEYWPFKYAGFGAGYRYLAADLEYDPGNKIEEYDVALPGPLLYVTFGF